MAGFLGFGNYEKEGPGVSKNAPQKHRFFVFFEIYFRKFWQLVTLNLIYVLFCIPIVTIGPATAGFTYVLRNFAREEHAFVWMDFIDAFRKNWKQGFIVGLVDLLVIALSIFNFRFYRLTLADKGWLNALPLGAFIVLLVFYLFMRYYIYMVLVTFDLSIINVYRNSFILGVMGFGNNILTTLLIAIVFVLTFYYPAIGLALLPVILLSTLGLIICFTVYPTFDKYLLQPSLRAAKGMDPFEDPNAPKAEGDDDAWDDEDDDDDVIFSDDSSNE